MQNMKQLMMLNVCYILRTLCTHRDSESLIVSDAQFLSFHYILFPGL